MFHSDNNPSQKRVAEGRWFVQHFGYTDNHYLSLLMFNMHTGPENVSAYIGLEEVEHKDWRFHLHFSMWVSDRQCHKVHNCDFSIINILL